VTHLLAPGHRLYDTTTDEIVIVLDVSKNGAVRLCPESGGLDDRTRLTADEVVSWFDEGRIRFEDDQTDAMLNPATTNGGRR